MAIFQDSPSRRSLWAAVAASSIAGALLGLFFTSTWQVAVESAQVVAGAVEYSADNAFYRYHVCAWEILHQILAVFLRAGISERTLSIAVSSLLCAALFGGITLCCHAICGNSAGAISAPLVWFALFRDSNAYGIAYPILLTGTQHTYGVAGHAAALWLVGLTAIRAYRSAAVLVAIAPALHPMWGVYSAGIAGVAWLISERDRGEALRAWPWFVWGLSITVLSFLLNRRAAYALPEVDPVESARYLEAFLSSWDGHRASVPLAVPGTLVAAATTAFAVYASIRWPNRFDGPGRYMVIALAIAGVSGLLLLLAAPLLGAWSTTLAITMPGRYANLTLLLFPAFLLGVPLRVGGKAGTALALAVFVYAAANWIFAAYLSSDKYGWALPHWVFLIGALAVSGVVLARSRTGARRFVQTPVLLCVCAALLAAGVFVLPKGRVDPLYSELEDPAISKARAGSGLIITGPAMQLIQLRTQRPILLNTGGLDQLPYCPDSGPAMQHALRTVYGLDLLNPPQSVLENPLGVVPETAAVELFARRSLEDWQAIAGEVAEGGAISVLVTRSHPLALTPAAESGSYILYDIPPATTGNAGAPDV